MFLPTVQADLVGTCLKYADRVRCRVWLTTVDLSRAAACAVTLGVGAGRGVDGQQNTPQLAA